MDTETAQVAETKGTAMPNFPRLIEFAFPLKQTSLDSVHEKNVRHGHISTLHIWPARRPLAACRAALIATLLPDPGDPESRRQLCEKIAGTVEKVIEKKKKSDGSTVEREKEVTKGGILHWGREVENADTLEWFRQEIRKAYGGRAPKVLDPFAGGGAIPLEAMRLGCEVTAIDINPVAWFILKCTLEYPQKLAGQTRPLPDFILRDRDFMEAFFKAKGLSKAQIRQHLEKLGHAGDSPNLPKLDLKGGNLEADLAWHVRAWGQWVLARARRDLASFYPIYADFEPPRKGLRPFEPQPMRLVPFNEDGTPNINLLNEHFDANYLANADNPRWVAKPTIAYLWARTVTCKNCRATIPLLKTRWLCKSGSKRVLLTTTPKPDRSGVLFGVQTGVPAAGGSNPRKIANDKQLGAGTMSRAGVQCPCCGLPSMTMEDIRLEGQAGRLAAILTAVVTEGPDGKEYRLPTEEEIRCDAAAKNELKHVFADIPFGVPNEPSPAGGGSGAGRAFSVQGYGLMKWSDLYTPRQLLALGTFVKHTRATPEKIRRAGYPALWQECLAAYSACVISRTADYMATLCVWEKGAEEVKHVFMRWALPITWDFAEANPLAPIERFFVGGFNSALNVLTTLHSCSWKQTATPNVIKGSAIKGAQDTYDLVFTDPPYYDAIPYSDLMDFFYVWLRRIVHDFSKEFGANFANEISPKWNRVENDGELIDDESRHEGGAAASKKIYEEGMHQAFVRASEKLKPDGHMVVVFANKKPDAWETLAASVIRAGFCVTASWPIVTEMPGGLRNLRRASLASSIWLVCKKRPVTAKPGWDNLVLEAMRKNIRKKLVEFWDAGIRGPDFVWAATGPALEAYSQHPAILKANQPKERMTVSEFLNHVRRLVVDYIVGQVLSGDQPRGQELSITDRLDEVTAYYLLHRHDFGFDEAPPGACILYAVSCGLSDTELATTWDLLQTTGADNSAEDEERPDQDDDEKPEAEESAGGKLKLKTWAQRRGKTLGYEAPAGKPVPLIDRIHRLMYLWRAGDVHKVDEFLDEHGLRRHELFKRLLQSIIELSEAGGEERSLLEILSNHLGMKGAVKDDKQLALPTSE